MLTPSLTIALVLACVALQGCILFTESVNQPPTVEVLVPTVPIVRGKKVLISANAADPDGPPPRVEWSTAPQRCHQPLDVNMRPETIFISPQNTATFEYTFVADGPTTVCVWAMAVDAKGATKVDAKSITSDDQAPVAKIQVLKPTAQAGSAHYPLYSYFQLSATPSADPDGDSLVAASWDVVGFPQLAMPIPELVPCPGPTPSDFVRCLDVGGYDGDYTVQLTVSDGAKTSAPAMLTLHVDPDRPACIAKTDPALEASPIIQDPGESRTFEVKSILDDGAPLPTPAAGAHAKPTFAWKVRRNAGAWQAIVGYDNISELTLPKGSYTTGDKVDVAVTISDGIATHLQTACDPGCPAGCPQAAEWAVEYR